MGGTVTNTIPFTNKENQPPTQTPHTPDIPGAGGGGGGGAREQRTDTDIKTQMEWKRESAMYITNTTRRGGAGGHTSKLAEEIRTCIQGITMKSNPATPMSQNGNIDIRSHSVMDLPTQPITPAFYRGGSRIVPTPVIHSANKPYLSTIEPTNTVIEDRILRTGNNRDIVQDTHSLDQTAHTASRIPFKVAVGTPRNDARLVKPTPTHSRMAVFDQTHQSHVVLHSPLRGVESSVPSVQATPGTSSTVNTSTPIQFTKPLRGLPLSEAEVAASTTSDTSHDLTKGLSTFHNGVIPSSVAQPISDKTALRAKAPPVIARPAARWGISRDAIDDAARVIGNHSASLISSPGSTLHFGSPNAITLNAQSKRTRSPETPFGNMRMYTPFLTMPEELSATVSSELGPIEQLAHGLANESPIETEIVQLASYEPVRAFKIM